MVKTDSDDNVVFQTSLNYLFNDAVMQGIMITDSALNIQRWNRWLEVHSGLTAESVNGKNLYQLYPELIDRKLDRYFTNALAGQISLLSQKLHHYLLPLNSESEGQQKYMQQHVRITPLVHDNNIVGTITIINDVTERVEREAELQRHVKILSALGDISEVALASPSLEDLLKELPLRISRALEVDKIVIFLRESNELVLRSSLGLDDRVQTGVRVPMGGTFVGEIAANKQPMIIEDMKTTEHNFAVDWNGVQSLMGTPLFVKGVVTGAIIVAASRVRRFNKEDIRLLQLVADRLAMAIDHTRLYEAERTARAQAETSSRLKDEFLATVSHELRTPLSSILGWTNLLSSGRLDAANSAIAIETIGRNARAQNDLINDLLDVSRIIAGKLRLNFEQVDIDLILAGAVNSVRPAAELKNIELVMDIQPVTQVVMGDESRLHQVFWNLLTNAVKFTPTNGRIDVKVQVANKEVQVSVSDTGKGINPDFLPYVFDRFRQADGSTTRIHGGLGLGLSIVRHLVELHSGRASVASKGEGKGSTFQVNLPIQAEHVDKFRSTSALRNSGSSAVDLSEDRGSLLSGTRILVVDDEPDARDLLKVVLDQFGAQVFVADSAANAIDLLNKTEVDVLISDIGMPKEDGYELIRKIRAMTNGNQGIPAVALTAYAGIQERLRVVEAGFQIHLPKPTDSAELVTIVSSLKK